MQPIEHGSFAGVLTDDGALDEDKLDDYVARMVKKYVPRRKMKRTEPYVDRLLRLLPTLREHEDLWDLLKQTGLSENTFLNDAVSGYANEVGHELKKMEDREDHDIDRFVNVMVTDKLISLQNQCLRSEISQTNDQPSQQESNEQNVKAKTESADKFASLSGVKDIPTVKVQIDNLELQWQGDSSNVSIKRSRYGDIDLKWKQGNTAVHLNENRYGDIKHDWTLGNVTIKIRISRYGDRKIDWIIDDSTVYHYLKNRYGDLDISGSLDKLIKTQEQTYVDHWCNRYANNYDKRCYIFGEFPL